MTEKKLGKGLGALLGGFSFDDEPETQPETNSTQKKKDIQAIPISLIDNNLSQPRKIFDPAALQELADSIAEYGVLQPILVTPVGNRYMIVAGERRWRACKMAGVTEIPAVIKMFDGKQIAEIAIIENLQRDDLNDMELAYGIKRLMDEHHLTQERVAERLSKPRSTIANVLRLITLPSIIQRMIELKQLTSGHAIRLLSVPSQAEQIELAKKVVNENLSVRALSDLIEGKTKTISNPNENKTNKAPEIHEQEKILSRLIGTKVKIDGNFEHGKIVLTYHAEEELNRLLEYLTKRKI